LKKARALVIKNPAHPFHRSRITTLECPEKRARPAPPGKFYDRMSGESIRNNLFVG